MIDYLFVVLISFFASGIGALLGIGGGVIMVPLFVLFVKMPIQNAVAISLFTIVGTSTLVSSKFIKNKALNLELGLSLELATTVGAIGGSLIALRLTHRTLSLMFGLFLFFVSFSMFRKVKETDTKAGKYSYFDEKEKKEIFYDVKNMPAAYLLSSVAGLASGMFGIGGGVLKVPLLVKVCKIPIKVATATSGFMVGITASAAAYVYFSKGSLNPYFAFLGLVGSLLGSKCGVVVHSKIKADLLRKVFAFSLIAIALFMIARAL
ncbi:sulfite exporter TauE/SafE family protein [Hippea alviniae]|uniref:sulfite exporter TauE/SafE family protein n=1 Tax=Hippea alviniae TaxID=1279027 RepID=UPI0003B4C4A1|nr:sulfite exporter TauE/SafE family protein [Hippea alviniae]